MGIQSSQYCQTYVFVEILAKYKGIQHLVVQVIVSLDFQFSSGQGLGYTGRNPS